MGQEIVQAFARSIWDYNNLQETLGNLIKRKGRQKEKQSTTNAVYKLLECNKSYISKIAYRQQHVHAYPNNKFGHFLFLFPTNDYNVIPTPLTCYNNSVQETTLQFNV